MSKEMNRREFIKRSAAIGVGSVLGSQLRPEAVFGKETVDICVVKGVDYFKNTKKAVELVGGMDSFVPKNSTVAILANPQSNNPGTYTKPEIVRAAIQMCKQAGAKKISCISWLREKYWINTGLKEVVDSEGAYLEITNMKDGSLFKTVPIPEGKVLKEAHIMKSFFNYDVFINIQITKEHSGNSFTGTLKNLMGLSSPQTNKLFHKKDWKTNRDSIIHMEKCIADLNTIIRPDLCIVDGTEIIITNGPFGPGEILKPLKVIAGTDRVAIDAYSCTLWGLKPEDIVAIVEAHKLGIGEIDVKKLKLKETEL